MSEPLPPREDDEYPYAIQRAGSAARRVFDRVERGLLSDGYSQEETDMLLMLNLDQILEQAEQKDKSGDQIPRRKSRRSRNT